MASPAPTPLLVVTLLFRSKPDFGCLPHVVNSVSAYLDSSVQLPIVKACTFGSIPLLDRIWNSSIDPVNGQYASWSIRKLLRTERRYRACQFTYSMLEAIERRDFEMVTWLMEHFPGETVWGTVVTKAAEVGALDILQYLKEKDEGGELPNYDSDRDKEMEEVTPKRAIGWGECDAAKAAAAGHKDVVKWLYEHAGSDERDDGETFKAAVGSGDVELVKWLMAKLDDVPEKGMQDAAANGHSEMVRWMDEECFGSHFDTGRLIRAAEKGHVDIVRWLVEREFDSDDEDEVGEDEDEDEGMKTASEVTSVGGEATLAIEAALLNGHHDIAQYLFSRAEKPLKPSFNAKERVRRWKLIEWLHRDIGPANISDKPRSGIMLELVINGRLDAVKWFYTEYSKNLAINLFWNYDEDEDTYFSVLDAAAEHGHLGIVKYLDKMCKLVTPEEKAKREELSNIDYSDPDWEFEVEQNRKEGCSSVAMDFAAMRGHLDVVQWLHDHRSEGCTTHAMVHAARQGHLHVVEWLHDNRSEGCTSEAMDLAARGGHLHVVKWLHEHRDEGCTTDAMDGAAASGHLEVVKWLHSNRSEGSTTSAMDDAARNGHLSVVRWLHENRREGCTALAIGNAALGRHFEVMLLLHRVRDEGCKVVMTKDDLLMSEIFQWLMEHYRDAMFAGLQAA
ncbi:hypothetical protein PHYSODRAFT_560883 [Phytophthora sojae]|uniref:Uncharacterized protein n=1 Tax=Phytophthora sojae (strain P6497) TaxID=1094619 RepID=G4ZLL3_PHYSP|nr:hypothetical protein PHYSODRAFT_560883 [Phytophthora sojae]EGZ14588.1 hypothetical protein PHYSODRAFT_560883 [Phytophthora sojae]|eukprot:XP_009528337.1 hypothetical protein PHYSODRAFT_560883 [Phytophthora sojae]